MRDQVQISFPGLGIETFTLNKKVFPDSDFDIRWYGVLIMIGIIAAFGYAMYRAKQEGFTTDNILDMGIFLVLFGVIGARLYYVLMRPDIYFRSDRTLWQNLGEIVNIRGGGLAIYGAIIAGALTLLVYCHVQKKDWRRALDMVAPGVMIAQAIGRWGNFFNGEAYGGLVSEGHPLYFLRMGLYPNNVHSGMAYVHPTFLYESLWNILGFVLINAVLYRRKKFHGQIVLTYAAWYGFGRMLIEGLRTDSLYLGNTGIRVSQLVGALCFVLGTAAIIFMLFRVHKQKKMGTYVPVFAPSAEPALEQEVASQSEDEKQNEITKENDNGKVD